MTELVIVVMILYAYKNYVKGECYEEISYK